MWLYQSGCRVPPNPTITEQEALTSSALVLDIGSHVTKVGFAHNDTPTLIFPTVIGRSVHVAIIVGMKMRGYEAGYDAIFKRGTLSLKYPVRHAVWHNISDMAALCDHIFNWKLEIPSNEQAVLLTDSILSTKLYPNQREEMAQILMEHSDLPGFQIEYQSKLALLATGRQTGIVIDSASNTRIVPIIDNEIVTDAVMKCDVGGADITEFLMKLIFKSDCYGYNERESFKCMKEQFGCVALEYDENIKHVQSYELPDGQIISCDNQQYKCVECLFDPSMIGRDDVGIHHMLYNSVMKCDKAQSELFENMVICGGNAKLKGIQLRLMKELNNLEPAVDETLIDGYLRRYYEETLYTDVVNLFREYASWKYAFVDIKQENKQILPWIGGCILSSLSSFQDKWITKAEYDEFGSSIVTRKPAS